MLNSNKRHYLLRNLEQQKMAEKLLSLSETNDFDDFLNFFVSFLDAIRESFFRAIFMEKEKKNEVRKTIRRSHLP